MISAMEAVSEEERPKRRVLVVDDDAMILPLLTRAIPGHSIEGFTEAEPALQRAKAAAFDVVLFDLLMPGIGGLDFFAQLVRLQPTADITKILMTGFVVGDELRAAVTKQGLLLLQKPFRLQDLYALLPVDMRPAAARAPVEG